MMSPRRHHFSCGHHIRWDCLLNGSQLNSHKGSSTGKLSYSSASASWRHHFSWGQPFTGATPVLSVTWNVVRGGAQENFAIPVPLLFWRLLPVPHLFPCNSSDWPTVFCIVTGSSWKPQEISVGHNIKIIINTQRIWEQHDVFFLSGIDSAF